MSLLYLNICISILIFSICIIRKFGRKKIATNFFCVLWELILIKLLLSFFFPVFIIIKDKVMYKYSKSTIEYVRMGLFEGLNLKLISIWIIISLFLIFLFVKEYFLFLKKIRKINVVEEPYLKYRTIFKSDKQIRCKVYEDVHSPLTLGIFFPIVIIPSYILKMNEEDKRYILYHELSHIKHKDSIWKIVVIIVVAIYWFNPFVWILLKYMGLDLELRCDHEVLRKLGKKEQYAELLFKFAKYNKKIAYLFNGFEESAIKSRIISILDFEYEERKQKYSIFIIIFFAIFLSGIELDFVKGMNDIICLPEAIEINHLDEREHPLYKYKDVNIKCINGKWWFEGKEIKGLVDIGCCIYLDEAVKNGQWIEVIRSKNGTIKLLKLIKEDEAWGKIQNN